MLDVSLRLNPSLDATALADRFAIDGRLQVHDFLTQSSAAALTAELAHRSDWRLVIQSGERVWEIDRVDYERFPLAQRAALEAAIVAEAENGFRFRFDSIRIPDHGNGMSGDLGAFARLMNDDATIAQLREVTREPSIHFADAQATRFRSGDFLGTHDDDIAGKHRLFAYVYNLTSGWRDDFGGLLQFLSSDGSEQARFVPYYNSLALFSVPQRHRVSVVAPLATTARLSITGWLRQKGG